MDAKNDAQKNEDQEIHVLNAMSQGELNRLTRCLLWKPAIPKKSAERKPVPFP